MAGCSTERQSRRETTAGLNYMSGQGGKSLVSMFAAVGDVLPRAWQSGFRGQAWEKR